MARRHVNGRHVGDMLSERRKAMIDNRTPFFLMRDGSIQHFPRGSSHAEAMEDVERHVRAEIDRVHGKGASKKYTIMRGSE
jgi:hypothetical protein